MMKCLRHELLLLFMLQMGSIGGCGGEDDRTVADDQYCAPLCQVSVCFIEDEQQREAALADCDEFCSAKIEEAVRQGSACESAFLSGTECVGALRCEEYDAWILGAPEPCPGERDRVEEACEGLYLEPHLGLPGP
ncbi:MAG: hypothetical protein HC927_06180 [Deltaproteobacteria bacterium]|nr:hypothetical protein [Deltaproteobacteria bacterium]